MNLSDSTKMLLLVATLALHGPAAAAESDFLREMARTDGDFDGRGGMVAAESTRGPASAMTREDLAFLLELARPDGLGAIAPVEASSSATAVAARQ